MKPHPFHELLQKHKWIDGYLEDGSVKRAYQSKGLAFLRATAKAMGWPAGSYRVRFNRAGNAVSGDLSLHWERVYCSFSQNVCDFPGYARKCYGLSDYGTGMDCPNHTVRLDHLQSPEHLAQLLRSIIR